MKRPAQIQHYAKNTQGRDFVVGDVHGCFTKLQDALKQLDFNPYEDRLFSVGDLVDRGPESASALDWLQKPWFHAVRGNHEQLAIDYFIGGFSEASLSQHYVRLGGAWFMALPEHIAKRYVDAFRQLPIALEIECDQGLVGLIHADCPQSDWAFLAAALLNQDAASIEYCLSSRTRLQRGLTETVAGISRLYVGHTIVEQVKQLGNVWYIDTGAVFGGAISLERIQ